MSVILYTSHTKFLRCMDILHCRWYKSSSTQVSPVFIGTQITEIGGTWCHRTPTKLFVCSMKSFTMKEVTRGIKVSYVMIFCLVVAYKFLTNCMTLILPLASSCFFRYIGFSLHIKANVFVKAAFCRKPGITNFRHRPLQRKRKNRAAVRINCLNSFWSGLFLHQL